jgi:copper chaperone CopZ/thiol-disulfide isomerase/thioredoxin
VLTSVLIWTALASAAEIGPAGVGVVQIEGMDCGSCNQKVASSLEQADGVASVFANYSVGGACLQLDGVIDPEDLTARLKRDTGYTVTAIEGAERCPRDLRSSIKAPWSDVDGLDAYVVSTSERVKLSSVLAPEKFTIVDFGASWCGPCLISAAAFKAYLGEHDDVAVRAIWLDGKGPDESFALAVSKQHLALVVGLPWFVVYDPEGKVIYRGQDHAEVLNRIGEVR